MGKTPTELNLKDCIKIYIEHNIDCLIKELNFDIAEATKRKEIVDGLLKALANIDEIIAMIKKSESSTVAKETLINKYEFTEVQAKAILAMRLSSLAKLEGIELNNEKAELEHNLADWNDIISKKDRQLNIIRQRLEELVKKYGDARRTELTHIEIQPEEKEIETVVPADVVVITTQSGLIKKVPTSNFKVQKKAGKGIKSADDAIMSTIKTNTVDYMMFFTDNGKMYRIIVDNIPDGTNTTKGVPINTLVQLDTNEKVIAVTSLHRKTMPQFAIFVTKQGMLKKTYLSEYMGAKRNAGIAALKVKEGDSVASIIFQDTEDMILITRKGMSIRFSTKEIGAVGRVAMGVKAIKLNKDDEVITALPIHKDTDTVGIITVTGIGKKVALKEFPSQARGGKGTIVYKDTDLAGAAMLSDEDNILISGNYSSICISATDLPLIGKLGQGNVLIKNNRVLSITKI